MLLLVFAGTPALLWLTFFATPDAPLLLAWAAALAFACRGERWWMAAGLAAGLAFQAKYTGALLYPLLVIGAGSRDWRTAWPWLGGAFAALVALPNGIWNVRHDGIAFGFQLRHGLAGAEPPGLAGLVEYLGGQLAVLSPLLAIAAIAWAVREAPLAVRGLLDGDGDAERRARRLAWWTAVPVVLFFAYAATRAQGEANWPAPAYVSVALGLSWLAGRWLRAASVGAWLGLLVSLLAVVHVYRPLVRLEEDPAVRLAAGPALGEWVSTWVWPTGTDLGEPNAIPAYTVYTERYQEAAFIRWYAQVSAYRYPGCGRPDQFDLWPVPLVQQGETALMVRRAVSGPDLCTDEDLPSRVGPAKLHARDDSGRLIGRWQLYEVGR